MLCHEPWCLCWCLLCRPLASARRDGNLQQCDLGNCGQCNSRCLRQTSQGQSHKADPFPFSFFLVRPGGVRFVRPPIVSNLRQELQKFTAPGRSWTEVLTLKTWFVSPIAAKKGEASMKIPCRMTSWRSFNWQSKGARNYLRHTTLTCVFF